MAKHVAGAVPFAATRTAHQVQVADGPTVSANWALDALGIGAMLDRDTDVTSTDPVSGQSVTAVRRGGQWSWAPAGAVVFLGSSGPGRITDTCCPVINFFTDPDNARTYQQRHGLTGAAPTLPDAAESGELLFGGLLHPKQPAQ